MKALELLLWIVAIDIILLEAAIFYTYLIKPSGWFQRLSLWLRNWWLGLAGDFGGLVLIALALCTVMVGLFIGCRP